jgi:polyisoprenoid-binding protein YceI
MADTATTATALPLKPGRWALDKLHSRVGFAVRHLGVSKVRGHFGQIDAELVVGPTLATTSISATVALASIDTGNRDRDAHLGAPDLLDFEQRPEMSFRSTGIRGDGSDWTLEGQITIGDVTQPAVLAVGFGGVAEFRDERHAGFEAIGELRRSDFGLSFGPMGDVLLGEAVKIELDLQFIEPS